MTVARGARRGVTFLEIMVVLVIIGIIAAVAIPNLTGTRSRTELRTAARTLAAAGIQARQMAISYGEQTELIIDLEQEQWMIRFSPEDEDSREGRRRSRMRTDREMQPGQTSAEQIRELPQRVTFGEITTRSGGDERTSRRARAGDELRRLTFYPNGSSSGMAIQLRNDRERSLTVDFDPAGGRPEIYEGEPKTMAEKLREMGLNPEEYGIYDDQIAAGDGRTPGEGFTRIGWSSQERADYYEGVAERLMRRAQTRYTEENDGPAAAYMEAGRWGR